MIDLTRESEHESSPPRNLHASTATPVNKPEDWTREILLLRRQHEANTAEIAMLDEKIRALQDEKRGIKQKSNEIQQRIEAIQREHEETVDISSSSLNNAASSSSSSLPPTALPRPSTEWTKSFPWSTAVREKLLKVFKFTAFRPGQQVFLVLCPPPYLNTPSFHTGSHQCNAFEKRLLCGHAYRIREIVVVPASRDNQQWTHASCVAPSFTHARPGVWSP